MLFWSGTFIFFITVLLILIFAVRNFLSGEKRAAIISTFLLVGLILLFLFIQSDYLYLFFTSFLFLLLLSFLLPLPKYKANLSKEHERFDERDISFARHALKPHSKDYCSYYEKNPQNEDIDAKTRALPGLFSANSKFYHQFNFAASEAGFFLLNKMRHSVNGPVSQVTEPHSSEGVLEYIKKLSKYHGVHCFGTARIKPDFFYSHSGRGGSVYGEKITSKHKYAIVLGVEMKPGFTGSAPYSPEVFEASQRYVNCAVSAVQIASFIRNTGFSARAHIDGNYQVVASKVANETGLGGFGWSNLFLTKKFGPRVRYSVVTTEMEIPVNEKEKTDFLSFCTICKKCAVNCPSKSIDSNKLSRLNSDRCFLYWNVIGTDCGKCLAVCPFGHPWGLLKSLALRFYTAAWLLKKLDDLFYGKKPVSMPLPNWMEMKK